MQHVNMVNMFLIRFFKCYLAGKTQFLLNFIHLQDARLLEKERIQFFLQLASDVSVSLGKVKALPRIVC